MRICIIFGHHNTQNSFNASVRDTFIDEAKKNGHEIDLINLFDEDEQLPFYRSDINPPPAIVLQYRKRLEDADAMFLIGACHNLRMNVIIENWIDWVLHPKWFFSYRSLLPDSKYFGNYGYPVPGAMKNKIGIVSMSYGGPMLSYFNFSLFDNIPYRRLKKSVFQLGGLKTKYLRFYSVLPTMTDAAFDKHMRRVRRFARNLKE
ncbi:MAG: NAD(P)H-dependent oxidoreductase [Gammaproteobacteria bacterium]|nr:NAD(P)H-dependent oxidoreductase [Gammaproteobacteria bacterium]